MKMQNSGFVRFVALLGTVALTLVSVRVVGQLVSRPKSGSPILVKPNEGAKDLTVVRNAGTYAKKATSSTLVTVPARVGTGNSVVVAPIWENMPKPGTPMDFEARVIGLSGSEYPKSAKKPNAWSRDGSNVYIEWDSYIQAYRVSMTQTRIDHGDGSFSGTMGPVQESLLIDLSLYDHATHTNYFTRAAVQVRSNEVETVRPGG